MTILDIGGGRRPALSADERPTETSYIGLDPDDAELRTAPPGSYSQMIPAPTETRQAGLTDSVDLAISWYVFEHVRSMEVTLDNIYSYLRPGGTVVSMFSGRWSVFGLINRLLPESVTHPIVDRLRHRSATNRPLFPAYYDACYATALRRLTARWSQVEITPLYRAASYFDFAVPLMRAYLAYENVAARRQWADAATHYLLVATR